MFISSELANTRFEKCYNIFLMKEDPNYRTMINVANPFEKWWRYSLVISSPYLTGCTLLHRVSCQVRWLVYWFQCLVKQITMTDPNINSLLCSRINQQITSLASAFPIVITLTEFFFFRVLTNEVFNEAFKFEV